MTAGCSSDNVDRKAVETVLAVRTAALNSHDVAKYLTVVSAQYDYKGKQLPQLKTGLENGFKSAESFSYSAEKPVITISGTNAVAVSNYRMNVVKQGKKLELKGVEQLKLVKEPGGWKITAGI